MEYIAIVQPASVKIRGNVAAGKGYEHVSAYLEYPRGGRSEIDRDPGGQSRGMTRPVCKQFLAILQVCWHCLAGRENCFQQSKKFAGHVGEGLHLHSVVVEVTTELLCKLNEPFTKLRVAFFFSMSIFIFIFKILTRN